MSLRGLFYLEQVVIPDPTMNTPRDMESTNGSEVVSPSFTKNFATQESSKDTKAKQNKTKTSKTIPIGDNEYVRPPSIHEKYAARPDSLEHICLAQFAVWYESAPKNSARSKKKFDVMSDEEIICPHLKTPLYMPRYIQLKIPELGCMYLREGPQILMFHKFDEGKDAHRFFYSELLLYFHWRSETLELHSEDFEACLSKYKSTVPNNPKISFIEFVKSQLFPEMNNVEMARALMEECLDENRPSHIGDLLDNQNEQDEAEQQFEGEQPDPEYEVRGYEGNIGFDNPTEQSIFKNADLRRKDEMLQRA